MKITLNYPQLTVEFVIVFFGVAIALAADSWREGLSDRGIEADYLSRLNADLQIGEDQLIRDRDTVMESAIGAQKLEELLKQGINPENESLALSSYISAAKIGFNRSSLTHDKTYQELISTGRLNIIRDKQLLSDLADYYNRVEDIANIQDDNPRYLLLQFGRLTGLTPYRPEVGNGDPLPEELKSNIIDEISSDDQLLDELRLIRSRHILLVPSNRVEEALTLNAQIRAALN